MTPLEKARKIVADDAMSGKVNLPAFAEAVLAGEHDGIGMIRLLVSAIEARAKLKRMDAFLNHVDETLADMGYSNGNKLRVRIIRALAAREEPTDG